MVACSLWTMFVYPVGGSCDVWLPVLCGSLAVNDMVVYGSGGFNVVSGRVMIALSGLTVDC
jgi:hypothetical protein